MSKNIEYNMKTLKSLYILVLKHNWKIKHCERTGEEEYRIDLYLPVSSKSVLYLHPIDAKHTRMHEYYTVEYGGTAVYSHGVDI